MLDVKEPEARKQTANTRTAGLRPSASGRQNVHFATSPVTGGRVRQPDYPVTARSTANGAVSKRRPGDLARLTPTVAPVPTVKRGRKQMDRLVQKEAKLVAAAVICTSVVCTLLVIYLAAYAQVSSLGIQMSKARVELHKQHLLGETLRAQVARAASPDRIAAAAIKNGMVLEHTQQICYVNPAGDLPSTSRTDLTAQSTAPGTQSGQARLTSTEGGPASPLTQSGTRMASRGANADTSTTTSVSN